MENYTWDDIQPVDITETTPQVCHILYSDDYKNAMGYLKALMARSEYSERALYITGEVIDLVPAHYTTWQYRFDIIRNLKKDIIAELDWCDEVALNNLKNYQIWHYRQLLIDHMETQGSKFPHNREYALIETMLDEDEKNYHVWSYRKWLAERYSLYRNEREVFYTEKLISRDVLNNSAWSYRFFISFGDDSNSQAQSEISFARTQIGKAPQNASSWNYLLGVYEKFDLDLGELEDFCLKFSDINLMNESVEPIVISVYALEVLAKIYRGKSPTKSVEIYNLLAEKYDCIRKNYWDYVKSKCVV